MENLALFSRARIEGNRFDQVASIPKFLRFFGRGRFYSLINGVIKSIRWQGKGKAQSFPFETVSERISQPTRRRAVPRPQCGRAGQRKWSPKADMN
jgi:hypothetical protein